MPESPAAASPSWPAASASQPPWLVQLPQQLAPAVLHPSPPAGWRSPPEHTRSHIRSHINPLLLQLLTASHSLAKGKAHARSWQLPACVCNCMKNVASVSSIWLAKSTQTHQITTIMHLQRSSPWLRAGDEPHNGSLRRRGQLPQGATGDGRLLRGVDSPLKSPGG